MKTKHYLIELQVSTGENTWNEHDLIKATTFEMAQKRADSFAAKAFSSDGRRSKDVSPTGYFFDMGCIHARVSNLSELTEEEYCVLRKFL
jgi:hypothetical protein